MIGKHRFEQRRSLAFAGLLLGVAWQARGEAKAVNWKIAPAPLVTRFAQDVNPDHARPEYPRPILVRADWKSLNGLWEFGFDDRNEGRAAGWQTAAADRTPLAQHILVPYTFEAALSGIGLGQEIHERVWYRRSFTVPHSWHGRRIHLNFNACDWESTVWVNGHEVGTHRGGYDSFSFDVTDALRKGDAQEVAVAVYDPADPKHGAFQPKGKQLGSHGIFYTRTTGIWQSVWLEPLDSAALDVAWVGADVTPELREGRVTVAYHRAVQREGELELILSRNGTVVAQSRQKLAGAMAPTPAQAHLAASNVELWSPEHPNLYDLTLRVHEHGKVVDEIRSYCGFRSYGIKDGRLTLNGEPYFLRGVLDQGYWPDGILTPPTDEAIKNDVAMTKALGFNMARKHVKIEDSRWYYWCDHLGLAVWQDMPSSHNLDSEAAKENFRHEWAGAIRTVRSYPCVLHWIPFNENWGNPGEFQDEIVNLTRKIDPSRPITDASGWTQRGLTDVIDAHDYGNDLLRQGVEHPVKPKVVGEYGGIALPVPGHTWTTGWGYQTARNPEALLARIRFQTTQLYEAANLSGFVYTQLTDVEQELNGLMTYDRQPKADLREMAAVFEGHSRSHEEPVQGFLREWLVLGPIPAGTDLRTSEDSEANRAVIESILADPFLPAEAVLTPEEGQHAPIRGTAFSWRKVHVQDGPIDFHRVFGGQTQNAAVYAVAVLDTPGEHRDATLRLGSDDGARVWLNGKQVWSVNHVRGASPDSDTIPHLTLRAGKNVLVVKVAQGVGGWGLVARFEDSKGAVLNLQAPKK